ncbi:MAG: XRE family transcriptional regulator [Flavobacterium psychrophilum]|nr:MAG: XRE family transcriptional regulator [Flavobacterium psychrophilum]
MNEDPKYVLKAFGNHLKQLRTAKRLTQVDLEVNCGVNNCDISKIEQGKLNITFTSLTRLARGLDLALWELVKFQE